jgi:hypothetical protein
MRLELAFSMELMTQLKYGKVSNGSTSSRPVNSLFQSKDYLFFFYFFFFYFFFLPVASHRLKAHGPKTAKKAL